MILLTGASGFIGSHILKALVAKYGIDHIIALTSSPIEGINCILHQNYTFDENYLLENGCQNVKVIIHAGAFIPKDNMQSKYTIQCNSNINSTSVLLNQELPDLEKIIFLSTSDVYKNVSEVLSEATSIGPDTLYGHSKYYCEGLVKTICNQKEIDFSILRIGHVYGIGEEKYKKLIPEVMRSILSNKPVKLWGKGKDLRSFIFISDVVQSILSSINIANEKEPINVVSDTSYSIKKVIETIIEVSGRQVKIERVDSNHIPRNLTFDNSRLKNILHIPEVDLFSGLKQEWKYMKKL